jgi:hypothetical protein
LPISAVEMTLPTGQTSLWCQGKQESQIGKRVMQRSSCYRIFGVERSLLTAKAWPLGMPSSRDWNLPSSVAAKIFQAAYRVTR